MAIFIQESIMAIFNQNPADSPGEPPDNQAKL